MAQLTRPAIQYDPRQPVSHEEWLAKWAELRQRDYPRPNVQAVQSAGRGKSQLFREEAG